MLRPRAPLKLRRLLARFERNSSGVAAVELALVGLPFLALLFAIFELGMIYLIATSLSAATTAEARKIRTCQLASTTTAQQFQTALCNDDALNWMGAMCTGNLQVTAGVYTSFQNTNNPSSSFPGNLYVAPSTGPPSTYLPFSVGNPGDIILVRTYYPWTLVTPGLDGLMAQLNNGEFLIEAASTFKNEPC